MQARGIFILVLYCSLLWCCAGDPIWKVFCTNTPVYRGRADPIVDPGILSQHTHKVWGGNNFGIGASGVSDLQYYEHIKASPCTTCSITTDLSDYWIPDLYYEWPNGSLSLVPNGGLTVYYLSRSGSGAQANPAWQPFPPGLRMTSGSPWRRSFGGTVKERAINYACLSGQPSIREVNYFPTNTSTCQGGLRAQVWFPMCWDGVRTDSPDHQSHMSHPIENPDGGNCPSTHPVRLPGVFFEILFDVNPANFPHPVNGQNPFRWANGDPTGYGLHGDFLNGWDTEIVRAALTDPMCDLDINPDLAFGNNVRACPPLAPYVKSNNPDGACLISSPIPTFEDVGKNHLINHMPGCNPIINGPANGSPCWDAPTPVVLPSGVRRVLIRSALTNFYVTALKNTIPLAANSTTDNSALAYSEVFLFSPFGSGYSVMSEGTERYLTATSGGNTPMAAEKGGVSDWEIFFIVDNGDGTVSIRANSNSKYVSVDAAGNYLKNSATGIAGAAEKFYFVDANTMAQQTVQPQVVPVYPTTGSVSSTAGSASTTAKSSTTGSAPAPSSSSASSTAKASTTAAGDNNAVGSSQPRAHQVSLAVSMLSFLFILFSVAL